MELGGSWEAIEADEDRRRTWLDDGTEHPAGGGPNVHAPADPAPAEPAAPPEGDDEWAAIEVPGHWRSTPAFANTDGPLLYRTRFEHDRPLADERVWLRFDGLFYQGDVWLDGGYVGDTEGYFFPHTFEVTEALGERTDHTLGVEVSCSPQTDRAAKRNITGVFQHWDSADPDANPGGIWRPVRLERTGPVCIRHLRVLCRDANQTRAQVSFRAVLDAAEACEVTLRSTVGTTELIDVRRLAAGENQVEWTIRVDDPKLWWPHALGGQPLHDVVVEVTPHPNGEPTAPADAPVSHRVTRRVGLRQIHLRAWVLHVNGERMFAKGANVGPTRMALAEATPEDLQRDVALAKDANLDLLRVHAHITRPEFYDAADEAGMLLWQDFPLQWGYARTIRKQAQRQAREAVDLLGHHPSIAIWCGHNEPLALDIGPGEGGDVGAYTAKFVAAQELPTWNKTILDRSVKRAIEKADGTRPVIAHSGVLPHPPMLDGTDSHLYFGWYHGDERDLPGFARLLPRQVRFVTEFGAQAVPQTADFCEPERWPDLDWERLGRTHGVQKLIFDKRVPPADYPTFDSWREATQTYQAELIRNHIETLRRLKYRPTGGFAQFCFADSDPAISWSVLDHERVPKSGFAALRDACRPAIVVADRLPADVVAGDTLALDVHVVSDLRITVNQIEVLATLTWDGGEKKWRFGGSLKADSVVRVGTIAIEVPHQPGPLTLKLELTGEGVPQGPVERIDRARIVTR